MPNISNDNNPCPPEEFEIEIIPLPDGGAEFQVLLKGDTLERVERLAEEHGMTLNEWLRYAALGDDAV
jgi:hypothetical protein